MLLSLAVAVPAQRFEWAKGWEGPDHRNNYITGTATDRAGNLYLLANYEGLVGDARAMWDGQQLSPDGILADDGLLLARISPQGAMSWRKVVLVGGAYTYSHELRMVGDTAVACLFTNNMPLRSEYGKLYYLDTLLRGISDGYPATVSGYAVDWRTSLAVFDTAGNMVGRHVLHMARIGADGSYQRDSTGAVVNAQLSRPSFDVDAEGNIYMLLDGEVDDGMCLLDNERRVGVVEGLQGASWSPVLLKLSPHMDTLLAARRVIAGTTSVAAAYMQNNMKVRVGPDGGIYVYGTLYRDGAEMFDTLLTAPGMSHPVGYSSVYNALLVKFDSDLEVRYAAGLADSVLNPQAAEYWQAGNLGSSFRELAFDADSGLLFVAGDCWQRDNNQPWQSAVYFVAGQPTGLVNHAYVLALDMAEGTLHSVCMMPSLHRSDLGWNDLRNCPVTTAAGLAVGGNRVMLHGVSKGGIYYPNLYRSDDGGRARLTLAQFDYAGHLVRGYDYDATGEGDVPAALAMRDSLLFLTGIFAGNPRFGQHEVNVQGYMGCVALMTDTSLMSPYVYTEPEWVDTNWTDTGSVGIAVALDEAVSVCPNPTAGRVTVSSGRTLVAAWVTDALGRREEVRLQPVAGGRYTLDLSARPGALYLLTVVAADGTAHTVRLVKQ